MEKKVLQLCSPFCLCLVGAMSLPRCCFAVQLTVAAWIYTPPVLLMTLRPFNTLRHRFKFSKFPTDSEVHQVGHITYSVACCTYQPSVLFVVIYFLFALSPSIVKDEHVQIQEGTFIYFNFNSTLGRFNPPTLLCGARDIYDEEHMHSFNFNPINSCFKSLKFSLKSTWHPKNPPPSAVCVLIYFYLYSVTLGFFDTF